MNALQPNTWRVHPLDPACWFLGDDTQKLLIPNGGTENAFIVFETEVFFFFFFFFSFLPAFF
jgi:hypothetical protein